MICPHCDRRLQSDEKLVIGDTDIYGMFPVSHVKIEKINFSPNLPVTAIFPVASCPDQTETFNKLSIGMLHE